MSPILPAVVVLIADVRGPLPPSFPFVRGTGGRGLGLGA